MMSSQTRAAGEIKLNRISSEGTLSVEFYALVSILMPRLLSFFLLMLPQSSSKLITYPPSRLISRPPLVALSPFVSQIVL